MNEDHSVEAKLEQLKQQIPKQPSRVPVVPAPPVPLLFVEWRDSLANEFPELAFASEVVASVSAQLLINDVHNPFGLVLVDVPSSGKTITLNFFSGAKNLTYFTDKFSPASFVSHATNVKKEDLQKIDMLPKIKHKVVVVREMATIFGEREEDLRKNMGILTRVMDGEGLQIDSGVHGQRGYSGDYCFMLVAASTPIPPKVWKMMGNLGSRLFFLNIDGREKSEQELVAQNSSSSFKEKEKICIELTADFLATLFSSAQEGLTWDKSKDDQLALAIIARAAKLLAALRAPINIWRDHGDGGDNHTTVIKEMPDRINHLLYNLARGHAACDSRNYITQDDLKVVLAVAYSSAPPQRVKVFKALLKHGGKLSTNLLRGEINCSQPTAIEEMKALAVLKVAYFTGGYDEDTNQEREITLHDNFRWFLTDEANALFPMSHTDLKLL
ncbi:hypothetical protein KA517_00880 [Candidatus Gracilibacteria bacterium]|nr:hypothetical protein [Candidatus Gracilibacteria bacterium]